MSVYQSNSVALSKEKIDLSLVIRKTWGPVSLPGNIIIYRL